MQTKTALIFAAGSGTRLGELTSSRPKALLEINGHSLLEINLKKLESSGYQHVIINTHHFHEQIETFVAHFDTPMSISISHEPGQALETGGGLLKALPLMAGCDAVLLHNVDVITDLHTGILHQMLSVRNAAAVLAVSSRPSTRQLLFDENHCLAGWTNSQTREFRHVRGRKAVYSYAFSGVSCLNPAFFTSLGVQRITLVELLLGLAEDHDVLAALPPASYWYDLGKAEQIPAITLAMKEKNILP
ncbi:MAG TPA: NTP transferase domain-containing protein [Bacteroidales bacterium]|nr:NTP transferase domain-containing protein [Bacteroidales bacterium]